MKKAFLHDGVVVAIGTALMDGVAVSVPHDGATEMSLPDDSLVDVGWRYTEDDGQVQFIKPANIPQAVGPNEFHFLWTIQEQVAIEDLRGKDKGVELFMRRLDDPRTTEVILAAPAIQAAIAYTVHALAAAGVIAADQVENRIGAISQGRAP